MRNTTQVAIMIVASLILGLVIGIGIAAATGHTAAKTVTRTVIKTLEVPKIVIETVTPPPPPAGSTVLDYSGSGTSVTPRFTVPSGNYTISWTFTGNSVNGIPGGDNFIISQQPSNDPNGGPLDLPNVIATSGQGSTGVTGDPGTHYFNVQATGSWTVKVVTG